MPSTRFWLQAGVVALVASLYAPAFLRLLHVLGVFRQPQSSDVSAVDLVAIEDTVHCEDLHLHEPSNTLFTACEDSADTRFSWFPGLATFKDPIKAVSSRGSIHTIDPKTFKSKRLQFDNFNGPFITHGIDVISDSASPDAVYIFAVNHVPHAEFVDYHKGNQDNIHPPSWKAASQIEVFHHVLGSPTVKHVRSIQHPLIKTPNDILARSPTSIYVTNDHYYPEGHMRLLEDVYFGAKWSTIVHIQIEQMSEPNPTLGLNATIVLDSLHNNNGLGNAGSPNEIAIGSASSGTLHIAHVTDNNKKLEVLESIPIDSTIDNPSFFKDTYATAQDDDSSGYVVAGLTRAADLAKTSSDPSATEPLMVWLVRPGKQQGGDNAGQAPSWEKKLLFEDDGTRMRSAATAVLIGIDPKLEGGKKKAWLVVTGFSSANALAVKVDL